MSGSSHRRARHRGSGVPVLEGRLVELEQDRWARRCHLDAAPVNDTFGWRDRCRVLWEHRFNALAIQLEEDHL